MSETSNGKNNKSNHTCKEPYDPDSIPGFTTYLYREHRFREPWEYAGVDSDPRIHIWTKEVFDDKQKIKELEKQCALYERTLQTKNRKIHQLEDTYSQNVETRDQKIKNLENQLAGTQATLLQSRREIMEFVRVHKAQTVTAQQQLLKIEENFLRYQELFLDMIEIIEDFGNHVKSCNFIQLILSGREIVNSEEKLCDCGWSSAQNKVDKANDLMENPVESLYDEIKALLKGT